MNDMDEYKWDREVDQLHELELKQRNKPITPIEQTAKSYQHPTSLVEFEVVYRKEYEQELESCDRWIKWCKEHADEYGVNFHQGLRGAIVFNNIKMEQLLRILKQEEPNISILTKPLEDENKRLREVLEFCLVNNHKDTNWGRRACAGHECRVCDKINEALTKPT